VVRLRKRKRGKMRRVLGGKKRKGVPTSGLVSTLSRSFAYLLLDIFFWFFPGKKIK
jgi:hypothetical protein